ncbi:MAG: hypothetical protein P8080_09740 [Gammaproteobacteria bacterium]
MKGGENSGDPPLGGAAPAEVYLFAPELDLVADRATGSYPGLERILGRGRARACPAGPWATLRQLLGADPEATAVAPVSFAGEVGMPEHGCLRLAPVGGRPEQGEVETVTAAGLGLSLEEARSLAAAFDEVLGNGSLTMHVPDPRRWYLHGVPGWRGGGAPGTPPEHPPEPELLRLLSEIEMLFFQHPVNQARAEAGQSLVTGVKAWGGGHPAGVALREAPALAGGEPWLSGLARLAGGSHSPGVEGLERGGVAWPVPVEAADTDLPGRLEEAWCEPLLQALGRGRLKAVSLVTRRRSFTVSRLACRIPWRRPRTLRESLC